MKNGHTLPVIGSIFSISDCQLKSAEVSLNYLSVFAYTSYLTFFNLLSICCLFDPMFGNLWIGHFTFEVLCDVPTHDSGTKGHIVDLLAQHMWCYSHCLGYFSYLSANLPEITKVTFSLIGCINVSGGLNLHVSFDMYIVSAAQLSTFLFTVHNIHFVHESCLFQSNKQAYLTTYLLFHLDMDSRKQIHHLD